MIVGLHECALIRQLRWGFSRLGTTAPEHAVFTMILGYADAVFSRTAKLFSTPYF
jgi:hypothetical protein